MKKNTLVSVIVPVYNQTDYLIKCIDTIIKQSYSDIEIILSDDGSTYDATKNLCKEYSSKDKRIKYIENEHGGVSKARNCGIAASQGDYIMFVDNDDYVELNMIEEYIGALKKAEVEGIGYSLIITGMVWENENLRKSKKSIVFNESEEVFWLSQKDIAKCIWLELFNFVTNKLYQAEIIKRNHITFAENVKIAEDLLFNIDYLQCVDSDFLVINKSLYHYVYRDEMRLSIQYYDQSLEHTKMAYNKLFQLAKSKIQINNDGMCVLRATLLYNWTARLMSIYMSRNLSNHDKEEIVQHEICSDEFQDLLLQSYASDKISHLRYWVLHSKKFRIYYWFRKVYLYFR